MFTNTEVLHLFNISLKKTNENPPQRFYMKVIIISNSGCCCNSSIVVIVVYVFTCFGYSSRGRNIVDLN